MHFNFLFSMGLRAIDNVVLVSAVQQSHAVMTLYVMQIYVQCCVKWLQLCPSLCDLMDSSPPGSSVHMDSSPSGSSIHGILQARTLEGVAMPSSRGSS